jgi:uncharacterized integral membrane protein (TIGR00697 family)
MFENNRFDVLVALYIFGVMVAQLMSAKTINLVNVGGLHLHASVAIFVMPLLFTLTDVVNEVYGPKRARRLVRLGLFAVVLQLASAVLFTALPPSERFVSSEGAYDSIFGTSIRFAFAALAAFTLSEFLDVVVYAKVREKLGKQGLWLRNNLSNFVSQFVDSAVFFVVAFYSFGLGIGTNVNFIVGLLIPYWLIRCALSVLETPLVYLGVRWLNPSQQSQEFAIAAVVAGEESVAA